MSQLSFFDRRSALEQPDSASNPPKQSAPTPPTKRTAPKPEPVKQSVPTAPSRLARTPSISRGFASNPRAPKFVPNPKAPDPVETFTQFSQRAEREFLQESAIAPPLYRSATRLVRDTEPLPGYDVAYPIHEALNWHLTRFGQQARADLAAILLLNEDLSCWQAKLQKPQADRHKLGKYRKYETPVGNGSRAYLPAIPPEIRQLIGQRYTVDVPLDDSFWNWLTTQPQIPLILTEGGKKALCLLSQGYVAIALYGINGGYRTKDALDIPCPPYLIPDLAPFAIEGREIVLAFDQDSKLKTRNKVASALSRFGRVLNQHGCNVTIATWKPKHGKGVDDLIVTTGIEAWDTAYSEALPVVHWQLRARLEKRLTIPAQLKLTTADLSTLETHQLPETGIIAIESAKGTGKTKWINEIIQGVEKVLAGGHRITLMRNLSERLGLDYKGDIDKANGDFITGSAYTLRIGCCVDSLLSFDPAKFAGCDLVLDEVVQVVRHLLTSSTCAKDGKRPALLARFHELIRVARRVIVADADLNNDTLNYLKGLREEDANLFLIRNDYQPEPYAARFLQCADRSAITADLLQAVGGLETGKVLFVTTDSKMTSFVLTKLIQQQYPEKRVLVVNSKTSGGDAEQAFAKIPDSELTQYDVIICSPSVATGVSIESHGVVAAVYGIFLGVSSTDADMSQALARVREPVPRVIWSAKRGCNFNLVSHSSNPFEVNQNLRDLTTTTISLIRCNLREDLVTGWDWETDPHIRLYCQLAAEQNQSMTYLRDALLVRLRYEGHSVTVEDQESNPAMKLLLKQTKEELKQMEAEELVGAADLTYQEVLALEQKESITPEETLEVAKFHFKEFYALDLLTVEDALQDNQGRWRGKILALESLLYPGLAIERTVKGIEKQALWGQGLCAWDISNAEVRRRVLVELGGDELVSRIRQGWCWTKYDLKAYADRARALAPQVKVALHLTINDKMSDTQIVHELLSQLGIKLEMHWSRAMAGHEGEKLRTYKLDEAQWQLLWAVLERRAEKRHQIQAQQEDKRRVLETGSPDRFIEIKEMGDPVEARATGWFTPESLAEMRLNWAWAFGEGGDLDLVAEIKRMVPESVLRHLGFVT